MNKFGNVFITTNSGSEISKLESVLFGNTDLKLYLEDGSPHPGNKMYHGKKFKLGLKFTFKLDLPEACLVKGTFELPYKFGMTPTFDIAGLPDGAKEQLLTMKKFFNITDDTDPEIQTTMNYILDFGFEKAVVFINAGAKYAENTVYKSFFPIWVFDDLADKAGADKAVNYHEFLQLKYLVSDVVKGKEVNLPDFATKDPCKFDLFSKAIFGMKRVYEAAMQVTTAEHAKPMLDSYVEWFDSVAFENCSEWVNKLETLKNPILQTEDALRLLSIGSRVNNEMIMVDRKILIDEKIRDTFVFKRLGYLFDLNTRAINDIFSVDKDFKLGGRNNIVCLNYMKNGLTLKDAFASAIAEFNQSMYEICEIGNLLIELFPGNKNVCEYVDTIKAQVFGQIVFYNNSTRYGNTATFDCYIDV